MMWSIKGDLFKAKPSAPFVRFCQKGPDREKCDSLKQNMNLARGHSLMYFDKYYKNWQKCMKVQEEYRSALRCAACDASNKYLINDKHKTVLIKNSSMNKLIKACYNKDLYESKLLSELYISYLNYAKKTDPSIMLTVDDMIGLFNKKINKCAAWVNFTKSRSNADMTKSRECVDYGTSLLNKITQVSKDIKFSRNFNDFINKVLDAIAGDRIKVKLNRIIPKVMQHTNNRILLSDLNPIEEEMVHIEDNVNKGYDEKLSDAKLSWKFIVSVNPNQGIDLEQYTDTGLTTVDFSKNFEDKNLKKHFKAMIHFSKKFMQRQNDIQKKK